MINLAIFLVFLNISAFSELIAKTNGYNNEAFDTGAATEKVKMYSTHFTFI